MFLYLQLEVVDCPAKFGPTEVEEPKESLMESLRERLPWSLLFLIFSETEES